MIKDSYGNTRFFGIYRGKVYDNADPLGKSRVRLVVPQILGEFPTDWAWPVESPTVPTVTPQVGQGLWVFFEGGDPAFPIWAGQFGERIVPAAIEGGATSVVQTPFEYPTVKRYTADFTGTGVAFTGAGEKHPGYNSYYVEMGPLISFGIELDMTTVTNFGTGQLKTSLPVEPMLGFNHFSGWVWQDPGVPADSANHIILNADTIGQTTVLDLHFLVGAPASPKPVIENQLIQGTMGYSLTTVSKMYVSGTYIAK